VKLESYQIKTALEAGDYTAAERLLCAAFGIPVPDARAERIKRANRMLGIEIWYSSGAVAEWWDGGPPRYFSDSYVDEDAVVLWLPAEWKPWSDSPTVRANVSQFSPHNLSAAAICH